MKYIIIQKPRNKQKRNEQALSVFNELKKLYAEPKDIIQHDMEARVFDSSQFGDLLNLPTDDSLVLIIHADDTLSSFEEVSLPAKETKFVLDISTQSGEKIFSKPLPPEKINLTMRTTVFNLPSLLESYKNLTVAPVVNRVLQKDQNQIDASISLSVEPYDANNLDSNFLIVGCDCTDAHALQQAESLKGKNVGYLVMVPVNNDAAHAAQRKITPTLIEEHAKKIGALYSPTLLQKSWQDILETMVNTRYPSANGAISEAECVKKLSDYIAIRGDVNAPEYKGLCFTLFGHTFGWGKSKAEKVAAATALKTALQNHSNVGLDAHLGALEDGQLKGIYSLVKSHLK